jgi:hypothetical protein
MLDTELLHDLNAAVSTAVPTKSLIDKIKKLFYRLE